MLRALCSRDVGPIPALDLTFNPRMNLLTGDNGLGKSFLLDLAWWALTRTWAGEPAHPRISEPPAEATQLEPLIRWQVAGKTGVGDPPESSYVFSEQKWTMPAGRPPEVGLVVYLRADGGCAVWDRVRSRGQRAFLFSKAALWRDGLRDEATGNVQCNGLLRDWIDWQQRDGEEFRALRGVLAVLAPGSQERFEPGPPTRLSIDNVQDIPTLRMDYGLVPLVHASAGVQRILSLAYLLIWTYYEHLRAVAQVRQEPTQRLVLLIDEVDAHLHPRWQRLIVPALLKAVESLQPKLAVQLLLTTHAPLVLASVEPLFDEAQDALILFEQEGPSVRAERQTFAPRGKVASWLTSEVFGLEQDRSIEAEQAIHAANAWMRGERSGLPEGLRTGEEIHQRLLALLPGDDIFWPRWVVHRERETA